MRESTGQQNPLKPFTRCLGRITPSSTINIFSVIEILNVERAVGSTSLLNIYSTSKTAQKRIRIHVFTGTSDDAPELLSFMYLRARLAIPPVYDLRASDDESVANHRELGRPTATS